MCVSLAVLWPSAGLGVFLRLFHPPFMFATRVDAIEDVVAALASALRQFTSPTLVLMRLGCRYGGPPAAALGAGGVGVHCASAVCLVSPNRVLDSQLLL